MQRPLRSFVLTLAAVSGILATAGYFYSKQQHIPAWAALPAIAALLIEVAGWVAMAFSDVRERLARSRPALWLVVWALVPYLVYSVPAGVFRPSALGVVAALALAASLWYVLLPEHPLTDLGFVALIASVILAHWIDPLYPPAVPRLRMGILGDLMWRRTTILSALLIRGVDGVGFGFLPRARDWKVGVASWLALLPVCAGLSLLTGFAQFHPQAGPWWRFTLIAAGTFLGMLWFVALSEEFYFRGLLQQWLSKWTSNAAAGLVLASALFGLAHLTFRRFPNWRFALLAAAAGLFYGLAFRKAGSIRAAMVTHALLNTVWRMLFA